MLVVAVAAMIGGCGGQDDDDEPARADGTPPPRSETSRPKGAPPPPAPADMPAVPGTAMLRDDRFDPSRVKGSRSSPVTFVNTDDHEHEIAIQGSDVVIAVQANASATTPPPKPGTYRLVCRLHEKAGMVGRLVIERQ